ncbi:hypothetical protein C9J85_02285 [Haloferax sp. wsp5]|nr:hypothetical protein C9J85_02285 [Haloferax sp. wsp5]
MAELTDGDVVSAMMEEFRRFSPGGAEALIDERDAYIAHRARRAPAVRPPRRRRRRRGPPRGHRELPRHTPRRSRRWSRSSASRTSASLGKLVGYGVGAVFLVFFGLLSSVARVGRPTAAVRRRVAVTPC